MWSLDQLSREIMTTRAELAERITAYLSGGGLFNPELANHEAVRDLLIDCRDALAAEPMLAAVCKYGGVCRGKLKDGLECSAGRCALTHRPTW